MMVVKKEESSNPLLGNLDVNKTESKLQKEMLKQQKDYKEKQKADAKAKEDNEKKEESESEGSE